MIVASALGMVKWSMFTCRKSVMALQQSASLIGCFVTMGESLGRS